VRVASRRDATLESFVFSLSRFLGDQIGSGGLSFGCEPASALFASTGRQDCISMDGDVVAENLISCEKQQVVCGGARPTGDTLFKFYLGAWEPGSLGASLGVLAGQMRCS
jgi:hypothetical protein